MLVGLCEEGSHNQGWPWTLDSTVSTSPGLAQRVSFINFPAFWVVSLKLIYQVNVKDRSARTRARRENLHINTGKQTWGWEPFMLKQGFWCGSLLWKLDEGPGPSVVLTAWLVFGKCLCTCVYLTFVHEITECVRWVWVQVHACVCLVCVRRLGSTFLQHRF